MSAPRREACGPEPAAGRRCSEAVGGFRRVLRARAASSRLILVSLMALSATQFMYAPDPVTVSISLVCVEVLHASSVQSEKLHLS